MESIIGLVIIVAIAVYVINRKRKAVNGQSGNTGGNTRRTHQDCLTP